MDDMRVRSPALGVFEARIKGGGDSTIYEHQFVHTLSNPSLALLARLML